MKQTFTRDYLGKELELPDDIRENAELGRTVISDTITGTSRWSVHHALIFRLDSQPANEAWLVHYRVGATESQDEGPWEHDPTIEATLVHEVEKLVKVWEQKS